jgi:hypothetical protein
MTHSARETKLLFEKLDFEARAMTRKMLEVGRYSDAATGLLIKINEIAGMDKFSPENTAHIAAAGAEIKRVAAVFAAFRESK